LKKLFLMSVFGLFMMVAMSGQSLTRLTLATSAWADQKADMETAALAKAEADKLQQEADQAKADADQAEKEAADAAARAKELGTEEAEKAAKEAKDKADEAEELAREDAEKANEAAKSAEDAMKLALTPHCAAGISSCYSADGSPGIIDLDSLPSTAAGSGDDDSESVVSVVKPRRLRSF